MRLDPAARRRIFTDRVRKLCAEAELPEFDQAIYDARTETLGFLWDHPRFAIAVPLRTSSVYRGCDAATLREQWIRKHGGDWQARLARGAIRRERPLPDGAPPSPYAA